MSRTDVEAALLAVLLVEPGFIPELRLTPERLSRVRHRKLFARIARGDDLIAMKDDPHLCRYASALLDTIWPYDVSLVRVKTLAAMLC